MKKNKPFLIGALIAAVFAFAVDCTCSYAAAANLPAVETKAPSCHAQPAPSKSAPEADCCGKCEVEKSAIVAASAAQDLQPVTGHPAPDIVLYEQAALPHFSHSWDFSGPEPGDVFHENLRGNPAAPRAPPAA